MICEDGDKDVLQRVSRTLQVPHVVDCLQGILMVIPLQLLSFHIAVLRGFDVSDGLNNCSFLPRSAFYFSLPPFLIPPPYLFLFTPTPHYYYYYLPLPTFLLSLSPLSLSLSLPPSLPLSLPPSLSLSLSPSLSPSLSGWLSPSSSQECNCWIIRVAIIEILIPKETTGFIYTSSTCMYACNIPFNKQTNK